MTAADPRREWAHRYARRGWPVFVLGHDKRPLPSCATCRDADWTHDREACPCLHCHGFYAATRDLDRLDDQLRTAPGGLLAVRTGTASGLVVVDAEADDKDEAGLTGLDVIEQWEGWVGWSLPPTLRARTGSGGLHLYYGLGRLGRPQRGAPRVLPNVDVKGDGGYVAVPCGAGERRWLDRGDALHSPAVGDPLELWLARVRGHRAGRGGRGARGTTGAGAPAGYDYDRCRREGPRRGERDEFCNDLLFRYRKAGLTAGEALAAVRGLLAPHRARWEAEGDPWRDDWLEYKAERVWQTVAPDEVGPGARRFVAALGETQWTPAVVDVTEVRTSRVGRLTVVTRERRFEL